MTTRVHIINFGPEVVEVDIGFPQAKELYPNQYYDFYVFKGQNLTLKEKEKVSQEKT